MKGYKGTDANMVCRGMRFDVGKTYRVDGEVRLCNNGIHFCESLKDVFSYYGRENGNRFFEVEAAGTIDTDGNKFATNEITIVKEVPEIIVNRAAYGYGNGDGNGNGYGNGDGDGDGDGNGYGNGYGYGYGKNIQKILMFLEEEK